MGSVSYGEKNKERKATKKIEGRKRYGTRDKVRIG